MRHDPGHLHATDMHTTLAWHSNACPDPQVDVKCVVLEVPDAVDEQRVQQAGAVAEEEEVVHESPDRLDEDSPASDAEDRHGAP